MGKKAKYNAKQIHIFWPALGRIGYREKNIVFNKSDFKLVTTVSDIYDNNTKQNEEKRRRT